MPNPKHLTERIFQSPSKYIQGPNAIKNAAKYLAPLGKSPLLAVDKIVYEIGTDHMVLSFAIQTHFFPP